MSRTAPLIALFCIAALPAQAAPIHETWVVDSNPTPDQITAWSSLPGSRHFVFRVSEPTAAEAALLARLHGADRVQVELTHYPTDGAIAAWNRLVARGYELVTLDAGLPNESEIEILNRITFSRHTIILSGYPDEGGARLLSRLHAPVEILFAASSFPRFEDKAGLKALPAETPLTFAADYWPWYSHMDLLNLIPQPVALRIRDIYPSPDHLPYLRNIKRLTKVSVDSGFAPSETESWKNFGALPVRWTARGFVPQARELAEFMASRTVGPRALTIDNDSELDPSDRLRLESSGLEVEWVRLAPYVP